MKKYIALIAWSLLLVAQLSAAPQGSPSSTSTTTSPQPPTVRSTKASPLQILTVTQNQQLEEFLALSSEEFKNRLSEINELLVSFEFSSRSINERNAQIRQYLRLSALALRLDDTNESIEFIYNSYQSFKTDFDRIMSEVVLNTNRNESLRTQDISDIRCQLRNMQISRREGNDNESGSVCPIPQP